MSSNTCLLVFGLDEMMIFEILLSNTIQIGFFFFSLQKASSTSNSSATKMDQVEMAFKKFDLDNDGFLSREEFDQVKTNFYANCVATSIW